jgi:hypothetical protein
MTVQDDKEAGQTEKPEPEESKQQTEEPESGESQQLSEKPEPNEENKKQAAEMMEAYEKNRATVVLPGSGGAISGTAVNDWLDDDGNPKYNHDDGSGSDASDDEGKQEQVEKDKAWNDELRKAADEENKGEKRPNS